MSQYDVVVMDVGVNMMCGGVIVMCRGVSRDMDELKRKANVVEYYAGWVLIFKFFF